MLLTLMTQVRLQPLRHLIRPLLSVLVAIAALCANASAQTQNGPAIGPPSDWVLTLSWVYPAKPEPNPTGQDFLLLDDQVRLATEEDYHRHAFQIVTESGRQHGSQVYINFDPSFQTLTIHHLKLIRAGVESDRLDPAKIQVLQQERDLDRQLYNGQRSALVILEDVRIGDIIDVAYTLRGRNPVFGGKFIDTFAVEWGTPVRDLRYRLLVPEERHVDYRQLPAGPTAPKVVFFTVQVHNGEKELAWQRTNIPIVESEERVPNSHQVFSFVDLSEFSSWGEVVEWARPLYALDLDPHPLLDAAVAGLRRKGETQQQRALAALDFVQQEIRYLGIEMGPGSHHPSEPEEVLRRRFGDCKDKARLLTALLQRLDLQAFPALVHSARREAVRERRPTPYAFDHVIVWLALGGQSYLLDPTMSYQRGASLDLRHVGTYGPYLRVAPGSLQLEDSHVSNADISSTTIREDFRVEHLEKPARLTVTTTSEGRAADGLRSYFANRTIEQIGREYLDYYTRYHQGISQDSPVEHRDNPEGNIYTVTEHYRIDGLFQRDNDGKLLRAEFEPAAIWDCVRQPNLAQRRLPYAISFPVHLTDVITINLPADWPITPQHETVNDGAFMFNFQAGNISPRAVRLEYSWTARTPRVETARLREFSANIEKARKMLGYQLTWKTAVPADAASGAAVFPPNWPMLTLAAAILLAGGLLMLRLVRRPNPSPPAPPLLEPAKAAGPLQLPGQGRRQVAGLGGWLILVALGMFVRTIMLLITIIQSRDAYFNASIWRLMSTPGSEQYQANYTLIATMELIVNFSLFTYALLLLVLFFRRSHMFPRAIQVFLGLWVLGSAFNLWDHAMLGQEDPAQKMESYKQLFQTMIGTAIWIPYFQVSRRVKLTFVR